MPPQQSVPITPTASATGAEAPTPTGQTFSLAPGFPAPAASIPIEPRAALPPNWRESYQPPQPSPRLRGARTEPGANGRRFVRPEPVQTSMTISDLLTRGGYGNR
jgi:hypothetical protein